MAIDTVIPTLNSLSPESKRFVILSSTERVSSIRALIISSLWGFIGLLAFIEFIEFIEFVRVLGSIRLLGFV